MKRINFAAGMLGDVERPGIQAILGILKSKGDLSPEDFVDNCLDLVGPLEVEGETRSQLVGPRRRAGSSGLGNP